MNVDFPEPLGPMIAVIAPAWIWQETPSRTKGPFGYRNWICEAEMGM